MKCWIVASRPYPEKIVGDRIYFDESEAHIKCKEINDIYPLPINVLKVYPALIEIDKG